MLELAIRKYGGGSEVPKPLIEQVLRIHDSVVITRNDQPPAHGFLISRTSSDELQELLRSDKTHLYFAANGDAVKGFCLVTSIHELLDLGRAPSGCFHYTESVSLLEAEYLFQIGVSEPNSRGGIGTALLNSVKDFHPKGLAADILVDPVKNDASLSFFAKHGFKTIGELHLAQYRDFGKLISSVMLWKSELAS